MSYDEARDSFLQDAPSALTTNNYLLVGDNAYNFSYSASSQVSYGDIDTFFIRTQIGHSYTIVTNGNTPFGQGVSNSYFALSNQNGNVFAYSVDYGDYSAYTFTALSSIYYIQAYTDSVGFYTLRLGDNTIQEANGIGETIRTGTTYNAALDYTSDVDIYTFYAEAGVRYNFAIASAIPDIFLDIEYAGARVDNLVTSGSGIYYFTGTNTGYYELHISSNSFFNTGSYSLITSIQAPVNNNPAGTVTIAGTPTQGQTLTASNSLADADGLGTIVYQWKADGSAIGGATGSTYVLTQAEVGKIITVTASYTDLGGTAESKTSSGTATVTNVNDAPTGSVVISGTPTKGQTLSASNTLADADGLGTIVYQWKADGSAIGGATGSTYVLTQAEVGKIITVTASYTDLGGAAETRTSAATTVVASSANTLPTGTVTIAGTPTQGQTLTASNSLADADGLGTIVYQWKADGSAIGGATGSTYVLTQAEVGKIITVTASYTDLGGTAESKTSSGTATVTNVNDAPTGSVVISGTPTKGQTLSASNTLADADGLGTIVYQWKADGSAIGGATGSTYVLTQSEVGKIITVTASYTDLGGTAESKTSAATTVVASVSTVIDTNFVGTRNNDTIKGGGGQDTLTGGAGADNLDGGEGSDLYLIGVASDYAKGEVIADTGTVGMDQLRFTTTQSVTLKLVNVSGIEAITLGSGWVASGIDASTLTQNLTIIGNDGNNTLKAGMGQDTLNGKIGSDKLTGGSGMDTFILAAGDSGQTKGFDIITDYARGRAGVGDVIDYASNLSPGGSNDTATSTVASVNASNGLTTFAVKSGKNLMDALTDIASSFTEAGDTAGDFALFQVNGKGAYHLFISDGLAGLTPGDVVVQLLGVTSISGIDLTNGNLTING